MTHDFDPTYGGCRRCAALPGDSDTCDPPTSCGRDSCWLEHDHDRDCQPGGCWHAKKGA